MKKNSADDIISTNINGVKVEIRKSKLADIKGFLPRYDEDIKLLANVEKNIKTSLARTLVANGKVITIGGILCVGYRVYCSWNIVSKDYVLTPLALFKVLNESFTQMQYYLYSNKMIDCLYALVSAGRAEAVKFNKLFGLKVEDNIILPDGNNYTVMKKIYLYQ